MSEEALFEMVSESIVYAKEVLEKGEQPAPFAMLLDDSGDIRSISCEAKSGSFEACYESLISRLRNIVKEDGRVAAVAIVTCVAIPEHCQTDAQSGIRVHLEERHKAGNKIGARFLYVPYHSYQDATTQKVTLQLQAPIPVSFPPEIFI